MGVLIPFLLGTLVGGAVTWQVDRRRQQGERGLSFKGWFSGQKEQSRSPQPQPSATDGADAPPSAAEATGTGTQTSPQTSYDI